MTTSAPTPTPLWQQSRVIGAVLLLALLAAAFASTTFVASGTQEIAADTALEYVELNYDAVVVPTITDAAQPLDELLTALLADADATGEEFGAREDATKPWSFAVQVTGTVAEGNFGEVGLAVPDLPAGVTVGVAIPPLGSNTAIRDAGTELSFGDFVNQTEFQNVAIELNNRVVETVFGDVDLRSMVGEELSVVGAFTWVSKTGGAIDHITILPVQLEAGA